MAERAGIDRLAKVATDFGLGAPSGLGLNGDVPGRVPSKAWYDQNGGMRPGYALNTVIGQGDTEVTVLQLALAYAALGNGGQLFVPQIVDRVETAEGKVVAQYPPKLRHRVQASARTLELVQRGLYGVVHDAKGTARGARLEGVSMAGKTGTAQVRKLTKQAAKGEWSPTRDHAWFAGYAPARSPKIAVVVLVEHGGKGGLVAAPVAMEIVKAWMELDRPPAAGPPRAEEPPARPPEAVPTAVRP
jgi:penicillin-binding protein 2